MKTYDDASVTYDQIDISYDGYSVLAYLFSEISHKSESILKFLSRTITETLNKTEVITKSFNRLLIETRTFSDSVVKNINIQILFKEGLNKLENVIKKDTFFRTFSEVFSKTELLKKSVFKRLSEIRLNTDIFTKTSQFFRTFTEKITKLDTWKGLINGTVIFFNRTKPNDSTFTNRTKPSRSVWTNRNDYFNYLDFKESDLTRSQGTIDNILSGQTFTIPQSIKIIDKISLKCFLSTGTILPYGVATLSIYNTIGGYPTGDPLGSYSVQFITKPSYSFVDFYFDSIPVNELEQYSMVLSYVDTSGYLYPGLFLIGSSNDNYSGGKAIMSTDGGLSWSDFPAVKDFYFKIWKSTNSIFTNRLK